MSMSLVNYESTRAAAPWSVSRNHWIRYSEQPFNHMTVDALFRNTIPAIRIKNFASSEECQAIVKAIKANAKFEGYTYASNAGSILKIGPAQCEFGDAKKGDYFADAERSQRVLDVIEQSSFLPLKRLMELFQCVTLADVSVAEEKGFGKYYAGVLRNISQGALLHMDFAQHDGPSWAIGDVQEQISWNLYLQAPQSGGEAVVYSRAWEPRNEIFKVKNSYHYENQVIAGAASVEIPFVVGDLVIFNSRNFHRVNDSVGERLTMSSFVGRKRNGDILFWS